MSLHTDCIHIALASDEKYSVFAKICLLSILENSPDCHIKIHFLGTALKQESINSIMEMIESKGGQFKYYELSDLSEKYNIGLENTDETTAFEMPLAAYNRLFLTSIIDDPIDKILYLDCDVILRDSISSIWKYDVKGKYFAGVLDSLTDNYSKTIIGLNEDDNYYNTGVMLINLKKWREDNLEEKFIGFLRKNNWKVYHHDQGVVNAVCRGDILTLPLSFNVTSDFYTNSYGSLKKIFPKYYSKEDFKSALKNPSLIHFTQGILYRPWATNCVHPFKSDFLRFAFKINPNFKLQRHRINSNAMRMLNTLYRILPGRIFFAVVNGINKLSTLF